MGWVCAKCGKKKQGIKDILVTDNTNGSENVSQENEQKLWYEHIIQNSDTPYTPYLSFMIDSVGDVCPDLFVGYGRGHAEIFIRGE